MCDRRARRAALRQAVGLEVPGIRPSALSETRSPQSPVQMDRLPGEGASCLPFVPLLPCVCKRGPVSGWVGAR